MNLLLGQYKNKHSSNVDNHVEVDVYSSTKLLGNDIVTDTIDQYQQYVKEKDKSSKYRLIFTINPICSNVLFNTITEVVYNEGADNCIVFGCYQNSAPFSENIKNYLNYKSSNASILNRHDMIEDTGFSHANIGPVVYHCGYDIFNNHTLRAKEFNVVNPMNSSSTTVNFNTIKDYLRDRNGDNVKDIPVGIKLPEIKNESKTNIRMYLFDTVYSFSESITNNLTEKDGWFGFINPTSIDTVNVNDYGLSCTLNKCMNNNKACEFIDMYPDRSLYSFVPKVNKHRKRLEPNWKYCITYPYENYYNSVVENMDTHANGLVCEIISDTTNINDFQSDSLVTFRTNIKNNFANGNRLKMTIISGKSVTEIGNEVSVVNVGVDGYDSNYYFTVRYDDIEDSIDELLDVDNEIRVRRIVNGKPCKYYFRKFKRLPNFKNTNVYEDGIVTVEEIDDNCLVDFNSSMNKIAFERTVFNDKTAQIIFNDDINVRGLFDNLGRPLSELYLTLVKSNDGYKEWYDKKEYTSSAVTYSHCFGKITSGLDLPVYAHDYNVHKIHNVKVNDIDYDKLETKKINLYDNLHIDVDNIAKNLEEGKGEITINGDTMFTKKGEFLGDIVEFSEYDLNEVVLEDVYFRFNTAQRELTDYTITYNTRGDISVSGEYANLEYDEISNDAYDSSIGDTRDSDENFLKRYKYNENNKYNSDGSILSSIAYPANVFPEGYYYKPHYMIRIKEFKDYVNEGYHTKVNYSIALDSNGDEMIEIGEKYNKITIKTDKNYYFEPNDILYLYPKNRVTNTDIKTTVSSVNGDNFQYVTINVPSNVTDVGWITQYRIYKHNSEKPDNAYELNDGTGRYLWRDVKTEIELNTNDELYDSMFVNGAHYFHKKINFFLRRQDPKSIYGLSYCDGVSSHLLNLTIDGEKKDISKYDYVETEENSLC